MARPKRPALEKLLGRYYREVTLPVYGFKKANAYDNAIRKWLLRLPIRDLSHLRESHCRSLDHRGVIRAFLQWAVGEKKLAFLPESVAPMRRNPLQTLGRQCKAWSADEVRRLLKAIQRQDEYVLALLVMTTGARREALTDLRWGDVEPGALRLGPRYYTLPPPVDEALQALPRYDDFVFTFRNRLLSAKRWETVCSRAGVHPQPVQELRVPFLATCLRAGMSARAVARETAVSLSTVQDALRRSTHLIPIDHLIPDETPGIREEQTYSRLPPLSGGSPSPDQEPPPPESGIDGEAARLLSGSTATLFASSEACTSVPQPCTPLPVPEAGQPE